MQACGVSRTMTPRATGSASWKRAGAASLVACALFAIACTSPRPTPTPTCPQPTTPAAAAFDATRAWQEFEDLVREEYAYLDRDDFDVAAQLAHSRSLAIATADPAAFRAVLQRTSLAFTDPHFLVGPIGDDDPNVIPTSSDLMIARTAGRYVVADVRAGSAADAAGIVPGWTLVTIDGKTVDAAIDAIWGTVVLARTDRQLAYAATLAANGRRTGERSLGLRVGDELRTVALANPRVFARAVADRGPLTVERRGKVAIVRFENSLGDTETIAAFDAAIEQVRDLQGLVLDLRNTPSGGNTEVARAILGHFVTEARAYQVHEIPAVERETGVPRRFIEQVLPRSVHFGGRVAVLGGPWTGSMGEGMVIGMHAAAGARTFASNMGDLLGGLWNSELELSGATVEFGGEALFHVDGTPRAAFVADVVLPHADRSPDGGDPGLAAALAWLAQ